MINPDELKYSTATCISESHLLNENNELKRMLSLFRAVEPISGCLDMERLCNLLVDMISSETGLKRALGFFKTKGVLELKVSRGVAKKLGKTISKEIHARLAASSEAGFAIERLAFSVSSVSEGTQEAIIIPVGDHNTLFGIIVLLNNRNSVLSDIDAHKTNIHFFIKQSLQAFENAQMFSTAKDMSFIDDLSGLYNHRYMDIALEREIKRVVRYASHLAVLFIDIDSFKHVNDIYGHLVGSRVLAEFGGLIKKSVREVDIVVRYGGDEYTIIMVETNCVTANLVAKRLLKQVEDHHFEGAKGAGIRLTCSIGYACCPDDTISKDLLLDMADRAMYVGKNLGKNRVHRITAGE